MVGTLCTPDPLHAAGQNEKHLAIPTMFLYTGCLLYKFMGRVPVCWDIQWNTVVIPPCIVWAMCPNPITMQY